MLSNSESWFLSKFPEALYPATKNSLLEYNKRVVAGHGVAASSRVIICGLARDLGDTLYKTIARIECLGSMFEDYLVVIYENDSSDSTRSVLQTWTGLNYKVCPIFENLKKKRNEQDKSNGRTVDMAYYRNQYLAFARELAVGFKPNYLITLDTDLDGGFSYEGICNSLSYDYDVVGSNGLFYREWEGKMQRLYYDSWAFRKLYHPSAHADEEINLMVLNRGEEPFQVISAFGGLALYKWSSIPDEVWYTSGDCDHVTLHKQMIERGFDKIYVNPSQITLYSPTSYRL